MFEIPAEIVLDREIALVNRRHPRQGVHVFENFAVIVVDDGAFLVPVGYAFNVAPRPAVGDLFDRKVEFVARDEIDSRSGEEALL
jgi:hypothetical protein